MTQVKFRAGSGLQRVLADSRGQVRAWTPVLTAPVGPLSTGTTLVPFLQLLVCPTLTTSHSLTAPRLEAPSTAPHSYCKLLQRP